MKTVELIKTGGLDETCILTSAESGDLKSARIDYAGCLIFWRTVLRSLCGWEPLLRRGQTFHSFPLRKRKRGHS